MSALLKEPCFTCRADVRYLTTRHGGQCIYNPDGSPHRCFPEREVAKHAYTSYEEILVAPEGVALEHGDSLCRTGEQGRENILIEYYRGGEFVCQSAMTKKEFDASGFRRTGRFPIESLEPDPAGKTRNGWLDRSGNIYTCDYWGHITLAGALERKFFLPDIEEDGWIKLQQNQFYVIGPVTQRQFDTICDYYLSRSEPMPEDLDADYIEIGTDDEVRIAAKRR